MRRLELRDCPREDTEREQRRAGGAAGGIQNVFEKKDGGRKERKVRERVIRRDRKGHIADLVFRSRTKLLITRLDY